MVGSRGATFSEVFRVEGAYNSHRGSLPAQVGWPVQETKPRVGCAGWSLPRRAAHLFPVEGSHLERYAQVFSCVEINSSFYRQHLRKTYVRWAQSVPESFRFSIKMPRLITHTHGLEGCERALGTFLDEADGLGDRLGCILVQLPPGLELAVPTVLRFFSQLRNRTPAHIVCEPRHRSWFTAQGRDVLDGAGVSPVWADPIPVADAEPFQPTGMLYCRLHGSPRTYYSSYGDGVLDAMAAKLQKAVTLGEPAWCIFDNTAAGHAVPDAQNLIRRLEP
ncbi:DUF72 domain-containing protein [Bacillus sp. NP157]|nr:DUF72 domain-containing protein [Bacillus sp. NP157]